MFESRDPSFEAVHNGHYELVARLVSSPVRPIIDFPQSVLGLTGPNL